MRILIVSVLMFAVVMLCLALSGCSAITTLQVVVDAVEVAIPVLQAAGVPVPPVVMTYVTEVSDCVANQNGSTAPSDTQLTAIAACLATKQIPDLPPGTSQAITDVITKIVKAVEKFLGQNPAPSTAPAARPHHNMKPKDNVQFLALKAKAADNSAKLKAIKQ